MDSEFPLHNKAKWAENTSGWHHEPSDHLFPTYSSSIHHSKASLKKKDFLYKLNMFSILNANAIEFKPKGGGGVLYMRLAPKPLFI